MDFCAHAHHDKHNMNGGCTMVKLSVRVVEVGKINIERCYKKVFGNTFKSLNVIIFGPSKRKIITLATKTSDF
jgi:hypothetical protein